MNIFGRRPFALCCFLFVLARIFGYFFDTVLPLFVVLSVLAVVISVFLYVKKRKTSATAVLISIFVLAGLSESLLYERYINKNIMSLAGTEADAEAVVISENFISDYSSSYDVRIVSIGGEKVRIKARLEAPYRLELDRKTRISARLSFSDFDDDDIFNEKRYYNSKGYYLVVTAVGDVTEKGKTENNFTSVFADINASLGAFFERKAGGEECDFIKAVFLGDRSGLSAEVRRDFKRTGTYHMLALSGMHLSVLAALFSAVLGALGLHKSIKYMLLAALTFGYTAMTGFGLSVIRSAIMLFTVYISYFSRAERDCMTSLMFAAASVTAFLPSSVTDIGFWLSVTSTFGIITATPFLDKTADFIKKHLRGKTGNAVAYLVCGVQTSVAAILMTVPFSAFVFGKISVIGPVVTVLTSPLVSLVLGLLPIYLVFPLDFIAVMVKTLIKALLYLVSELSDLENIYISLDYSYVKYVIVIFFAVFAVLLIINIKHKFVIPIFAFLFFALFTSSLYVSAFCEDTSVRYIRQKKNEYFCVTSHGENALIDISDGAYSSGYVAAVQASKKGMGELDVLVYTHLHRKHIVSFSRLLKREKIREIWLPEPESEDEKAICAELCEKAEEGGTKAVVYMKGSKLLLFGAETLVTDVYKISRSTHKCILLEVTGDIDFIYLGASYLENADVDGEYKNIFVGIHGPISKKEVTLPTSKDGSTVFVATEALTHFIQNFNEHGSEFVVNTDFAETSGSTFRREKHIILRQRKPPSD